MKHFGMPRAELKRLDAQARAKRAALWDWFEARKRARPFAGLAFFQKTNVKGSIVIASRHWPDSITWSWSLWWRSKFGRAKARWPVFAYTTNSGGNVVFGPLELHWQDEMPNKRVTRDAERRFIDALRGNGSPEETSE